MALSLALCLLSLAGLPPLAGFFGKLHLFWCGWQAGLYFLVLIGLLTSVVSIYYYLKIIKLLMTGRNQEITPYVRNYRRSPLSLRSILAVLPYHAQLEIFTLVVLYVIWEPA